jgi:hypothetical protein
MAPHDVEQRRATVLKEVPTIGNVDGVGCTAAPAVGKTGAAIAGDDFDSWVLPQPSCEAVRLAIRQEIDNPALLEVDQNGAVAMAAAPRPVVDADHARRDDRFCGATAHQPQQRVAAGRHAEPVRQSRSRRTAECEGNMTLDIAQPSGPLSPWATLARQTFGKDPPCAGGITAVEPASSNVNVNMPPLPGQIGELARVAAMNAHRGSVTDRAGRRRGAYARDDDEAIGTGKYLLDDKAGRREG